MNRAVAGVRQEATETRRTGSGANRAGRIGIGILGAGVISGEYLENLTSFPDLDVAFVADLDVDRARAQAERYGVRGSGTVAELMAEPEIEIVVNLTLPAVHVEVARSALRAGKHVWTEKPFALDRESGRGLLDEANRLGLRVATAPDTVLGAGLQTALRAIAEGRIGTPQTALAVLQSPGPDLWHPNPEFLFQAGAGPLFDIGPYYLTALVLALGPASRVTAASATARTTRTINAGPRAGLDFAVTVPTHHGGLIEFESGASAQFVFSFQSHLRRTGMLEITGTSGTIALPDPNAFDGDSRLYDGGDAEGQLISAAGTRCSRGTGVAELAQAIRAGRPERASGELGFHVLDIMVAITESAQHGRSEAITSTFEPRPVMPESWDPRTVTPS